MSPEAVIFNGEIQALSCLNSKGVLDVLPGHSNFMSMIKGEVTVHLKNGITQKFPTKEAILEVTDNKATILTNTY
jgi:F0F1-type ATP synthase epsilon subunit